MDEVRKSEAQIQADLKKRDSLSEIAEQAIQDAARVLADRFVVGAVMAVIDDRLVVVTSGEIRPESFLDFVRNIRILRSE